MSSISRKRKRRSSAGSKSLNQKNSCRELSRRQALAAWWFSSTERSLYRIACTQFSLALFVRRHHPFNRSASFLYLHRNQQKRLRDVPESVRWSQGTRWCGPDGRSRGARQPRRERAAQLARGDPPLPPRDSPPPQWSTSSRLSSAGGTADGLAGIMND